MIRRHSFATLLLTFAVTLGGNFAHADDATPADIATWVKQLDDDDFATRQTAQQNLQTAGKASIDAVREAAVGESQEAAVRAIEILQKHVRGDDASVKQAAEAALKKLSDGENKIVADRAANALKPKAPKPADTPQNAGPQVFPRPVPFGGGGIRIEARAIAIGGKGAMKMSVKNVDGNKEIDVEEKDRKIKITESAEGKIKVSITTKVGDMESTKDFEADSAEALKKKDAEAHKVYEKYSKGGIGGGRIEFRALPAGPREVPRIRIAPHGRPVPLKKLIPAQPEGDHFERAIKQLEEARKQLEAGGANADAIEDAIKNLEELREKVEAAKEE